MIGAGMFAGLLSPATVAGLQAEHNRLPVADEDLEIDTVLMYLCPECDDPHEYRDDAVSCCEHKRAATEASGPGHAQCPVCGSGCSDEYDAANCCLWKDLAPAARFSIARAVERGSEWKEAIALHGASK